MVVFDCNIYLDAARVLGEPFTWGKLRHVVDKLESVLVPHPKDEAFDSLRALNYAYAVQIDLDNVEVWASYHIAVMVRYVLERPVVPSKKNETPGLGWSAESVEDLLDELIFGLVTLSGGGIVKRYLPDGNPPLDHEDGKIYGACRALAGDDPLAEVYCVTRDREFRAAYRKGLLGRHTQVIAPAELAMMIRQASAQAAFRRILGDG
ncbi:hypothetical protein [Winogradskya consettensis]|uniref:hypothetical protein n=1 Tax=Winogradskya consettensis TaxID=113560 RepID=UPI001BB2F474|nr:hypothetical protein [Actinoplanes consettensis]